jgi:AcrR family transcriptional regulator
MPRAFTEQERELIARRLLEHGYRLFSAHGLKKTNIEDIATAAGISKGAFYRFYESKEALLMDVVEQAETRVRREVLAAVDLPGPSPRARLFAVLQKAYALFEAMPILQFLTGSDYELLFRRLPADRLREHLVSDRAFIEELVARCRSAGIPIRAQPEQIIGLLYPLVLVILHEDDLGQGGLAGSIDLLLELVAAFCLGEVEAQLQKPAGPAAVSTEGDPA